MKLYGISTKLMFLMMFFTVTEQKKDVDLGAINDHLRRMCLKNPENYIKDPSVVKCGIMYDESCWKETKAGTMVAQPCPFLRYSKGNIIRRCDEQGKWEKVDKTNCTELKPNEPSDIGKQISNISVTTEKDDSLTHAERVERLYVIISWVEFFILLPTLILIYMIMRGDDRFTLHKNLILAFILRIQTLFVHYYGSMRENESKKTGCNVFWLLNRYFAASEITWMLNEGIFLLRILLYPSDSESYLWFYCLFGWGFSGVLTFCVYLPYVQFTIARVSESCWVTHSHTNDMLVLYVPLTIMLMLNFIFAVYVVHKLAKKLKNSRSTQMNTIRRNAKAVAILITLFGLIYLIIFYQPANNPGYNYFVAVVYPLQGIMVCIVFVYLSVEFRESFRRHWMKWRYGILIDTNPYATRQDLEPGPSDEQGTSASVLRIESSENIPHGAGSIASLQETSRPPSVHQPEQLPERPKSHNSQLSLLSRSSDLTKYRLKKVEPEPLKPARVQSAGPEAWCPPTLHAVTAWQEVQPSENQEESSTSNQGLENKGFSAKSESDISNLGSQISLKAKPSSQTEIDTKVPEKPINIEESTEEDSKETLTPNSEDAFSFSSQLFTHDSRPSTAEFYKEYAITSATETSDDETLTATEDSTISQDVEPSTSTEDSSATSRGGQFWMKARKLAAQRRRSRVENNKVLSTEGDSSHFHQSYADKLKDADEYRMAWIAKILQEESHDEESEA